MLISNTGFSNTYPADEHRFPDVQRQGGVVASPSRVARSTTSGAPPAAQLATSLDASDRQLAANYIQALSSARWTNQSGYLDTELADIPARSTFGKWWQQYRDAMNNPNFVQWAKTRGLDVSSILLEPHAGFLSAFFNGRREFLRPETDAGWKEVSGPILSVARVLAPSRSGTRVVLGPPTAPAHLEAIGNFYGEPNTENPTREQARARAVQMSATGVFAAIPASDPERSQTMRGPQALGAQQQVLADIDDHYSVVMGEPDKSSRAKADKALAAQYVAALRNASWSGHLTESTRLDDIPMRSTLGHWWQLYCDAFNNPQFQHWVKESGLDLSTMVISPITKEVSGAFNDEFEVRSLDSDAGWASVAAPILNAAGVVFGRHDNLIKPPSGYPDNSPPLRVVGNFLGQDAQNFTKEQAASAADRIAGTPSLTLGPRQRGERYSLEALGTQQLALANARDRYNLIQGLTRVVTSLPPQAASNLNGLLDSTTFDVHPHSSFGQSHSVQPGHTVSLRQFLQGSGLSVPGNREQVANLLTVLASPLPKPSARDNYWRLLSPFTFSREPRALIQTWSTQALDSALYKRVFEETDQTREHYPTAQRLKQLVSSPQANALGESLRVTLQGKADAAGGAEWAAAAIVLSLDPLAGTQRNRVAGYDLAGQGNWGKTPTAIVDDLTRHLVVEGSVSQSMAPVATRLLLAGTAPELLVADVPADLVYGSHTWASFSIAVARIEKIFPGASQSMTFKQIMTFGSTQPISPSEHVMQAEAQRNAMVDWGVVNGMIAKRSDDTYSNAEIELARSRFNQQLSQLIAASNAQQAAVPSRRDMALAQLKATFGDTIDYEKRSIRHAPSLTRPELLGIQMSLIFQLEDVWAEHFSILELYMAGVLDNPDAKWVPDDEKIPFDRIKNAASTLPVIGQRFDESMDRYSEKLKSSVAVNIQNMIARLPLKDRRNFEFGTPTLYSAREGFFVNSREDYADQAASHKGHYGLIIRTRRTSPPTDYELFPGKGILQKKTGLPDPLPLGPSNANEAPMVFSGGVTQGEEAGQPFALDFKAYQEGTSPRTRSVYTNIILDEVRVSAKEGAHSLSSDEPADSDSVPRSFFTRNTKKLAQSAADFFLFNLETLKNEAKGVTHYERVEKSEKDIKDTLFRMIPFVAAAQAAKEGNYVEAFADAGLDVFGFLVPEYKLAEEGEGLLVKAGSKLVGSLSEAGAETKIASKVALVDNIGELSAGGYDINRQHRLSPLQLNELAQRPDIAMGSVGAGGEPISVVAQFDDASQKWYAYDAQTAQAYGPPLSDFTPETSAPLTAEPALTPGAATLLDRGLAQDNVIQMGGAMKDLKFIGSEVHTFTDVYKGRKRLNIVAHGTRRDWVDKLLRNGSEVVIDGKAYNANQMVDLLKNKGVDPADFDNVRLLICHSAEGKGHSFASQFQKAINRPVKAFEGTVAIHNGSTSITSSRNQLLSHYANQYPGLTDVAAQQLADSQLKRDFVNKVTQHVEKRHGDLILINTAGVGQPPKHALQKINYVPRHFS